MRALFDHAFLGRGFRPFFLLGAIYGVMSIFFWAGFYAGYVTPPSVMADPVSWHAHEMIYGFAVAIIAGFLLTAVANWTGGAPVRQMQLAGLCMLWLTGRIVVNFNLSLPFWLFCVLETAFIPALAVSLAIPLLKRWNKRNFVFMGLLSALFACDISFLMSENRLYLHIALLMIAAMISLVGGRVIPAFTVSALRLRGIKLYQTDQMRTDIAALASLVILALLLVFTGAGNVLFGSAAIVSGLIHAARMRHYHTYKAVCDPMLWVLQAGYLWLLSALLLLGLSGFGIVPFSLALHALTAGAIGTMTLGMMCRVTLGHTGREIKASSMTTASFVLMIFAGALRVSGPLFFPEHVNAWIISSALIWSVCFAIYAFIYAPMLLQSRPESTPV